MNYAETENNEQYYFAYSATLRIFGVINDLDEISSTLGLDPTQISRRGERKSQHSLPYEFDMWAYTSPVPEDRPLDIHIETLWNHIRLKKDYLVKLKERFTVDVFCGYRSNSATAGFEVSPKSLGMFIELDIPFGVSIIIA